MKEEEEEEEKEEEEEEKEEEERRRRHNLFWLPTDRGPPVRPPGFRLGVIKAKQEGSEQRDRC